MAAKKSKSIDLEGMTNDELISLVIATRKEAQRRGIEAEAEVWAGGFADDEATRIARAAAEREAARLNEEKAIRTAHEAAEKIRREAREAEEKAKKDAEIKAVADLWADKEAIGAKVREILGTEIEVPTQMEPLHKEVSRIKHRLARIVSEHAKWEIAGYTWRFATEAEAIAQHVEKKLNSLEGIRQIDHAAEIAELEAALPVAESAVTSSPKTFRKSQYYRLEVWSRGSDVRVYIARTGAGFGASLFDYFHTGNHKQAPQSSLAIHEEIREAAKARGVTFEEIHDGLKALCADICKRYTVLKIDRC